MMRRTSLHCPTIACLQVQPKLFAEDAPVLV